MVERGNGSLKVKIAETCANSGGKLKWPELVPLALMRRRQIKPGDWVWVKNFRRGWCDPRWSEPLKVILAIPTGVKVEGKAVLFHLNHCITSECPDLTQSAAKGDIDKERVSTEEGTGAEKKM